MNHCDPGREPRGRLRRQLQALRRALSRLLVGLVAIVGAVLLVRQGLVPLVDAVFGPGEAWLSVVRRSGILLAAVAAYWLHARHYERRAVPELQVQPLRMGLAGAGGALLVGVPVALLFALGVYEQVAFNGFPPALLGAAGMIAIAAVLEELVYRCLLFQVLERGWGSVPALAVQAVVFAALHLANLERGDAGEILAMLASVTLLGLLWALLFVLTRNLWVVAAHHAAWNFTILLAGLPLSGIEDWRALAPIDGRLAGPDWLTGGQFGPESALPVILWLGVAVVLMARMARRRGLLRPAQEA